MPLVTTKNSKMVTIIQQAHAKPAVKSEKKNRNTIEISQAFQSIELIAINYKMVYFPTGMGEWPRSDNHTLKNAYEQFVPPPNETVIAIAPAVQNIQVRNRLESRSACPQQAGPEMPDLQNTMAGYTCHNISIAWH